MFPSCPATYISLLITSQIGAVSGGVDSTVAARLLKEAIGDRFHAVLVDTGKMTSLDEMSTRLLVMFLTCLLGLMRLNECQQVKETLDKHLGINLTVVDGSELFLSRLAGITEPEAKRKIIGGTCEANFGKIASLLLTSDYSY